MSRLSVKVGLPYALIINIPFELCCAHLESVSLTQVSIDFWSLTNTWKIITNKDKTIIILKMYILHLN